MYSVTVIFTRHDTFGNCNSFELERIIESIAPEVIFEELSNTVYDQIYNKQSRRTLESDAVRMCSLIHKIEHIPVDTFEMPMSYYEQRNDMVDTITGSANAESQTLRDTLDAQMVQVARYGFSLLNSELNDEFITRTKQLRQTILNKLNDEKLHAIVSLEEEVIEKRENEIISNIYEYSKHNKYHKAILLIGAGHRNSIMMKIRNEEKTAGIAVNWTFLVSK